MNDRASTDTHDVVKAYHDHWTSGRYREAVALLAEDLKVEVPINSYPDRLSFAGALEGFGSMVEHVDLLGEFSAAGDAMLLYDMEVRGIGTMRIAEHFTVADGKIARLRQIHDTAPIRQAGLAKE